MTWYFSTKILVPAVCFMLVLYAAPAQNPGTFYLKPSLTGKLLFDNNSLSSHFPDVFDLATEHFTQQTPLFNFQRRKLPLAGISVGYTLRKNENSVELGLMQDVTETEYSITVNNPLPGTKAERPVHYRESEGFYNFSFLYKHRLLRFKLGSADSGKYLKVFISLGASYCYEKGPAFVQFNSPDLRDRLYTQDGTIIEVSSAKYVSASIQRNIAIKYNLISLKYNLGLDFYLGTKEKEWFTTQIGLIYNQGLVHTTTRVDVKVIKNQQTKNYIEYIRRNGNGIYFTVSKRFYLRKHPRKNT